MNLELPEPGHIDKANLLLIVTTVLMAVILIGFRLITTHYLPGGV